MTQASTTSMQAERAAHTPGPLHVQQDSAWPYTISVCDQAGETVVSEPLACSSSKWKSLDDARALVGIHGSERDEWQAAIDRQRADMNLWAAAPELLAAVSNIVSRLGATEENDGHKEIWRAAFDAIAKARGEA